MKDIDNIPLPKSSSNEELEELSRKIFSPLFDESRFILKDEFIDNGIDYRIEIKKNNNKLGYGFNFQLKSTDSIKQNIDDSYSKNIETSNIEYLLNNGQPAYYGLYIKETGKVLYIYLNDVIRSLYEKDNDWEKQANHTLRFITELNQPNVELIYNNAIDHGNMLRKINYNGALLIPTFNSPSKLIVDYNKEVVRYPSDEPRLCKSN